MGATHPEGDGRISLSVILLAFNEAETVGAVIDETRDFLSAALDDWEVLVVDDGSTDATADVVRGRAAADPRVRLVQHDTNRGMGAGVRSGVGAASKSHFVYNAADGQVPAVEIGKLLPLLERADVALSTYARRESAGRALVSRGFRLYLRATCGIRFRYEGLYIFPTAVARELLPRIRARTFFLSFELIQRGVERGLSTDVTEMVCRPRESGASKVLRPRRVAAVAAEALSYGIRRRLRR